MIRGWIVPGYLFPGVRAFYFFLFLIITVSQTYCSLLMEEQMYPERT